MAAPSLTPGELGACIAAFVRLAALVATAPVVGDTGVSVRARLAFVVAAAAGIGLNRPSVSYDELPATCILEMGVGLITGLSARFVMSRVAIAGQLMGFALGLGFASEYDAHAGESAGVVRMLTTSFAGLAFVAAGGLEAIVRSAGAGPATVTQLAGLGPMMMSHGVSAMGRGLALAAPIVLAALVGNIGLAVMNRAAPAVNVFSIAFAAVLIIGGALMIACAPSFAAGVIASAGDAVAALLGS